eukprot:m.485884 g.485884  ORF g.485884 m.485884 type:complete len:274 (+) comp24055_c0_seq1:401-1222(+)
MANLTDTMADTSSSAWFLDAVETTRCVPVLGCTNTGIGLLLGLLSVVVAQVLVVVYHYFHLRLSTINIQKLPPPPLTFWEGLQKHVKNPEGFALLGSYLILTWVFNVMPASYYSARGGVNFWIVAAQLISQDFFQMVAHWLEHKTSPRVYRMTHKPHHVFTNPRLFDAFDGSAADTVCMILLPLFATANLVPANVWEYMVFGASYAAWLTLIHSEIAHPWDPLFRLFGLGTAADHHVHHKVFVRNYGHLFTWWDRVAGTYKSPHDVRQFTKAV